MSSIRATSNRISFTRSNQRSGRNISYQNFLKVPSVKKPIIGVISQGQAPFTLNATAPAINTLQELFANPMIYSGVSGCFKWSDLNPGNGVYNWAQIDAFLQLIVLYNAQYPAMPARAKIRVYQGINCPAWVYSNIGSATLVQADQSTPFGQVCNYWTLPYSNLAWGVFVQALAARYDSNPLVATVCASDCSTITAEPLVQLFGTVNTPILNANGFTDQGFQNQVINTLFLYTCFQYTPVEMPMNPLTWANDTTKTSTDGVTWTNALMLLGRVTIGNNFILGNNGLLKPSDPVGDALRSAMQAIGGYINFQSYSQTAGTATQLADAAIPLGATSLELFVTVAGGGYATYTPADLQTAAALMAGI